MQVLAPMQVCQGRKQIRCRPIRESFTRGDLVGSCAYVLRFVLREPRRASRGCGLGSMPSPNAREPLAKSVEESTSPHQLGSAAAPWISQTFSPFKP